MHTLVVDSVQYPTLRMIRGVLSIDVVYKNIPEHRDTAS